MAQSTTNGRASSVVPRASRAVRSAIALALVTLAAAAVALSLVACAPSPPSEPAAIIGTVTSLVPGDERPDSMRVETGAPPTSSALDKAQVAITPQTQFFDAKGAAGDAASIKLGTKVAVWFEGPVAESYPVQGRARAVQIFSPDK